MIYDKKKNVLLTEEEQIFLRKTYDAGQTNVTSLVSSLYAMGNEEEFTPLKKTVSDFLGIKDVFRSITTLPLD